MRKEIGVIITAAVLYTLWIGYSLLEKFQIVNLLSSEYLFTFGFAGSALICTVVAAAKIEYYRYKPFILVLVLMFGGVLIAYAADITCRILYGKALYLLPFGSIDYFLFCLLATALMKQLRLRNSAAAVFTPFALIPLVLLFLPVYFHILQDGFSVLSIYSLFYTAFGAAVSAKAILFAKSCPEHKLTSIAVIFTVLCDLSLYFVSGLNIMLLPFAFFLLAADMVMVLRKEDAND